jgi:AraC-like DNA-binding protein
MDISTKPIPEGFEGQRLYRVPPAVVRRMRQRPYLQDFRVTDLGYFPNAAGHRVERPAGAASHILIFVESGRGWLELCGCQPLSRGDVVLIPPHRAHAYGADPGDPWKIYWFHFDGGGARALLKWTPFSGKTPSVSSPLIDSFRRHFHTALAAVERGYSEHALLELSRALINVLTLLHSNNPSQSHQRERQRIERVMDAMRKDLKAPRTLPDYAKEAGLSVSRFSESFKKHCGVSPMSYFTELRIQHACELLDNSDLQIGEIAESLGFEDRLYFSRRFSKHTGMPPSTYRRRGIG